MNTLLIFVSLLAGCGHEKLDFHLPDAGSNRGSAGTDFMEPLGSAESTSSFADHLDPRELARPFAEDAGLFPSTSIPGTSSAALPEPNDWPAERYQYEPDGYPARPGQRAAWCVQGQSFHEICGNDVDDDCDGIVDEYSGIGAPCRSGCGEGMYVCRSSTNALLCLGAQGCMNPVPAPCGDGLLGGDEECDPNAPNEKFAVTCTASCKRPLFVSCFEGNTAHPERCDELHTCSDRIGACVPLIGPSQRRCPHIPIEGSTATNEFYPMLETEDGECWITCRASDQCPSTLSDCYMGFCAVPF